MHIILSVHTVLYHINYLLSSLFILQNCSDADQGDSDLEVTMAA